MCLYISDEVHLKDREYAPKVAKCNLHVAKALRFDKLNNEWKTPYLSYPIKFVKGRFTFPKTLLGAPQFNPFSRVRPYSINEGIHAHTSCEIRCSSDCRILSAEEFGCYPYEVLDAIIPKGTKYYVGDAHEVVAENMILFETEKNFQRYCRWHRVKNLITISDNSVQNRVSEMKFDKVKKSFRKKGTTVLGW